MKVVVHQAEEGGYWAKVLYSRMRDARGIL